MKAFSGYRFLLGPEQLSLGAGRRVATVAEYLAWHTAMIVQRGAAAWDSPRPAIARVNHGRWIADCVWCQSGMLTRPQWRVAYCAECGARYHPGSVRYPDDHQDIESVLLRRIRRDQQNWDRRQTAADLLGENRQLEAIPQ